MNEILAFDDVSDKALQCVKCRYISVRQPRYVPGNGVSRDDVREHIAWGCLHCGHEIVSKCADEA